MKLVTATFATAVLLALAGVVPSAQAQDQQQQQDKTHPPKPQQKPQRPQQMRQPQERQQRPQEPKTRQEQPRQPEQKQQKAQQNAHKNQQRAQEQRQKTQQNAQRAQQKQQQKTQHRAASQAQQNRTQRAQQAAPARGGTPVRGNPRQTAHYEQAHFRRYTPQHGERVVRIPDAQFSVHFGRGHRFHIGPPVMVGGFPRFQYSGFWFVLEEPWPGYWGYGSDFYIVFTDGNYWLCDYDDPGVEIELVVIA
jgi:hypothetical protein